MQSADEEESSFCRAAARLGWDPYAIDDRQRDLVLMLAERLGGLFDEAASVLDPNDLEASAYAIVEALEEAKGNALSLRCLAALSKEDGPEPDADLKPERAGSALAKRLRQALGAPAVPASDLGGIGLHAGHGSSGDRSSTPAGRAPCQGAVR